MEKILIRINKYKNDGKWIIAIHGLPGNVEVIQQPEDRCSVYSRLDADRFVAEIIQGMG